MSAFLIAQLVATLIAVYANWGFAQIRGIGWGWAGIIWIYSIITYIPLDPIKFLVRYILSGKAWELLFNRRTAFTEKKDFGREDREAQWARQQRTLHGLDKPKPHAAGSDDYEGLTDIPELAHEARRRAEIARLRGEIMDVEGDADVEVGVKGDAQAERFRFSKFSQWSGIRL
ncbi:hypothetical protein R1flu_004108 [Riccia fluitans]|uniref:Uncharacterized protein n=1 Tax=Riccia fluitans TaxID=41844 RepID=A0ABD1YPC3_9MARC